MSLSWHQIDVDSRTIRRNRTKTDAPLIIPMTKRLHAALSAIRTAERTSDDAVFRTVDGERWSNISLRRYFAIAKDLAKIQRPFRFHDMRHDFASALAQQGVSLFVIAQLLGHASTRMTMRYAHLHPTNLRSAVDSLKGR